jgi:glycine/D-amino acid oxidase-like deaminating enzyme
LVLSGWFVLTAADSGKKGNIQPILYEVAMKRGVVVHLACPVESVSDSGPSVVLSNGDIVKGDVIVATDSMSWELWASPSTKADLGNTSLVSGDAYK